MRLSVKRCRESSEVGINLAERIFGFSAEEMIGQPITKIIPPERQDEEPAILERLKRGERVDHFETVRIHKNGRRIDVSVTISPIKNERGQVIGASKIARDISFEKRAKRERERLYELGRRMAGEFDVQSLVQAITDVATELSGAQFGAFFYNVVNAAGESYMLYTISGVPREHFAKFPMPRSYGGVCLDFRRNRDCAKRRYHPGSAIRKKCAAVHGMPEGHLPVRSYLAVPVFFANQGG